MWLKARVYSMHIWKGTILLTSYRFKYQLQSVYKSWLLQKNQPTLHDNPVLHSLSAQLALFHEAHFSNIQITLSVIILTSSLFTLVNIGLFLKARSPFIKYCITLLDNSVQARDTTTSAFPHTSSLQSYSLHFTATAHSLHNKKSFLNKNSQFIPQQEQIHYTEHIHSATSTLSFHSNIWLIRQQQSIHSTINSHLFHNKSPFIPHQELVLPTRDHSFHNRRPFIPQSKTNYSTTLPIHSWCTNCSVVDPKLFLC
jgi:hypothetical protein